MAPVPIAGDGGEVVKPVKIIAGDLSGNARDWLYRNFIVPNGVRHFVPLDSPVIVHGNQFGVLTMDIERNDQVRRRGFAGWSRASEPRRWRPWRSRWPGDRNVIPLKFRVYRIRRPLTNQELANLYDHERWQDAS